MTKARDLANVRYTKGSTDNRPTGNQGDLYFDTTADTLYEKTSTSWLAFQTALFSIDALVIAGGGSGSHGSYSGAGGGAGGYQEFPGQIVSVGNIFNITVGAGGTAPAQNTFGNNGVNSSFGALTASVGGGGAGGGGAGANNGRAGGSGGGGATNDTSGGGVTVGGAPTTGQGFAGGGNGNFTSPPYPCGGGGGGGAAGQTAPNSTTAGNGGIGKFTTLSNSIGANASAGVLSGGNYYFAGGGGGACHTAGTSGTGGTGGGGAGGQLGSLAGAAGTVNTGGGGGSGTSNTTAGAGGSGIVVLRYSDFLPDITTIAAGLTYTRYQASGYKFYKFTSGTGNITI
jgi:hypothetical protein